MTFTLGQNNRIGLFEITTTATRGKLNVPILILWDSDGDGVVQVGLNDDGVFPGWWHNNAMMHDDDDVAVEPGGEPRVPVPGAAGATCEHSP